MSQQRKSKSAAWRRRQEGDAHVRAARAAGYRSRAAYKLLEIDKAHRLLRHGMTVIDLGATPGGWAQVAAEKVGRGGRVVAVDLLPLAPLAGVQFIQGDFNEPAIQQQLWAAQGGGADIVLCDLAPNLSGIAVRDQANAQALFTAALAYCSDGGLKSGGDFLIKTFAGEQQNDCRQQLLLHFTTTKAIIPAATRKNSRECYLLARNLKANPPPP